jgi:hypothetical protein
MKFEPHLCSPLFTDFLYFGPLILGYLGVIQANLQNFALSSPPSQLQFCALRGGLSQLEVQYDLCATGCRVTVISNTKNSRQISTKPSIQSRASKPGKNNEKTIRN